MSYCEVCQQRDTQHSQWTDHEFVAIPTPVAVEELIRIIDVLDDSGVPPNRVDLIVTQSELEQVRRWLGRFPDLPKVTDTLGGYPLRIEED